MTIEEIISPALGPIVGGMITAAVGLSGLFFKWLSSNFKRVEDSLAVLKDYAEKRTETVEVLLNSHENHDQQRHEENLHRFERISVALAKLGSSNGTHKEPESKNATY